jgi:hypothetical protein
MIIPVIVIEQLSKPAAWGHDRRRKPAATADEVTVKTPAGPSR